MGVYYIAVDRGRREVMCPAELKNQGLKSRNIILGDFAKLCIFQLLRPDDWQRWTHLEFVSDYSEDYFSILGDGDDTGAAFVDITLITVVAYNKTFPVWPLCLASDEGLIDP